MAGAGKIFINYRRGDDPGFAQLLYAHLEAEFGAARLFMDIEGHIKPGDDFIEVLGAQVAQCDVLLAIVGPRWAELLAARAEDAADFVAIEIEAALGQGKRVIPVLVGGAEFPPAGIMPASIRALARKNAVGLRPDRFKADCQGLFNALKEAFATAEAERAARTEAERQAAEDARKRREAEEQARAEEMERTSRERALAGLTPEQIREAKELANWDFIKDSTSPDEFRDHLARFAGGDTERFARKKLEALLWTNPATRSSIEALRNFVAEFPQGDHAVEARAGLATLEKPTEKAAEAVHLTRTPKQREELDWFSVKISALLAGSPSAKLEKLEAYLRDWPDGANAKEAKARIRELRGSPITRRGVVKGIGIGAAVTAAGGGILYSVATPGDFIWRLLHDQSARTLAGHTMGVNSVAFSPDGWTLASGSYDNAVKLWDVTSGRELRTLTGHTRSVTSVAFSPDGRTLASGSSDKTVKLWDVSPYLAAR